MMKNGWPDAKDDGNQLKFFLTDPPKERRLPPLKNSSGSGVVEPPLQHPTTQHYSTIEITLSWRRMLGLKPGCEEY